MRISDTHTARTSLGPRGGSVFSAHRLGTVFTSVASRQHTRVAGGASNVWSSMCLAHFHSACGDETGAFLVLGERKWIHCRNAGADAIQDARAPLA